MLADPADLQRSRNVQPLPNRVREQGDAMLNASCRRERKIFLPGGMERCTYSQQIPIDR